MTIVRVWKRSATSDSWIIWDLGNEFWELRNNELRHFTLLDRTMGEEITEIVQYLKDSPIPLEAVRQEIQGWEVVEHVSPVAPVGSSSLMKPMPLHQNAGENVMTTSLEQGRAPKKSRQTPREQEQTQEQEQTPREQEQTQEQEQEQQQVPHSQQQVLQSQVQTQRQRQEQRQPARQKKQVAPLTDPSYQMQKRVSLLLKQGPAFLPDTPEDVSEHPLPQTPPQAQESSYTPQTNLVNEKNTETTESNSELLLNLEDQGSQEEHSSQPTYIPPNEIWSSLSQWIPSSALFQPSLHHQAFLESSGIQDHSYPSKKDSDKARPRHQAPHQYARRIPPSKPYYPTNGGLEKQEHRKRETGPLFI